MLHLVWYSRDVSYKTYLWHKGIQYCLHSAYDIMKTYCQYHTGNPKLMTHWVCYTDVQYLLMTRWLWHANGILGVTYWRHSRQYTWHHILQIFCNTLLMTHCLWCEDGICGVTCEVYTIHVIKSDIWTRHVTNNRTRWI
jgi:hypothetical protein